LPCRHRQTKPKQAEWDKKESQVKESEWKRTTRECSFADLRPELVAAIRQFVEKHKLPILESEVLACCETTSESKKAGLAERLMGGGDKVQYTGVLVTPSWLIWAASGDKTGVSVTSARLTDIAEVRDYEDTPFHQLIEDHGLQIYGFRYHGSEREVWFLGLGQEYAAQRFRDVLREAIQNQRT
jgi:hypothetical protein